MTSALLTLEKWETAVGELQAATPLTLEVQASTVDLLPAFGALVRELEKLTVPVTKVFLSELYWDGASFYLALANGLTIDFSTSVDSHCGATLAVSEVCELCTIIGYRTEDGACSACGNPATRIRGTRGDLGLLGKFFYRPAEAHQFSQEAWEHFSSNLQERLLAYGTGPLEAIVAAEELCLLTTAVLALLDRPADET